MSTANAGAAIDKPNAAEHRYGGKLPLVLATVIFTGVVGAIAWFVVDSSQRRLIEFKTLNVAEVVARQASEARSVYSGLAVAKLKRDGTGAHVEADANPGFVPLPAQFFGQLSERASANSDGLYSFGPISKWNLGDGHEVTDDFQRWAWSELEKQDQSDPAGPIEWRPAWRIEDLDGARTLRYLRADPAVSQACVDCHNRTESDPATIARRNAAGVRPGKRWKRHQLMGAVEVAIPLERSVALAREQSQAGLLLVVGVTLIAVVGIGAFLFLDMSRRNQMAATLAYQANHDALTGLPNRAAFDRHMATALAEKPASGLVAMLLDLDNFKEINDTLGHQIGDRLLEQLAQRLQEPLRKTDMVARLGGDEFGFVMVGSATAEAESIARRVTALLDQEFAVDEYRLLVRGSIGIVVDLGSGRDHLEIMRCADVAMYAAKKASIDFTIYEDQIDDNKVSRLTFIKDLRKAIRGGDLRLCYQPKFALPQGRVVGAEALLRWTHPELGPVPPQEIVPVAERTGLVRQLTEWVLSSAIEECARWNDNGMPLHIAVNLSVLNLEDDDFAYQVERCLAGSGLAAERLTLEVTESAMMHDPARAAATLAKLAGLGVRLSVDDFGTGYSSLSYLHRMPVNELKLDKSFVMRMNRSDRDVAIVKASIEMAHSLGLSIVAEGVENEEILNLLRDLGSDLVQGFHLSRPLEVADLRTWLEHQFPTQPESRSRRSPGAPPATLIPA